MSIPLAVALLSSGCSVKKIAMNQVGNALSGGGTVFAGDDDPELIRDALPFSLKLMESVLEGTPEHDGLLTSLTSGFTQYSYGFVQLDADEIEDDDFEQAEVLRARAIKLYERAYRYGMRGFEARYKGFGERFANDAKGALEDLGKKDSELLYWTGLALAGSISLSLDDPEKVGRLSYAEAMMERVLEMDPTFDNGAIHSFFVTYEMSRLNSTGDPVAKAKRHFAEAKQLSNGNMASVYVAYAESIAVSTEDREAFISMLNQALAIDLDARPDWRLSNLIYQRRAKWLLTRLDWYFL